MKTKEHKTFSEIESGNLTVEIWEENRRPCVLPVFVGLGAVRDHLSANGGYASIKADYCDGMTGWTIYRKYPEGHRACGVIRPA